MLDEKLEKIKNEMKTEDTYVQLSTLMKLFADGTRVKILDILCKYELCVDEIASILNITKSAISHQLKPLKNAKLIKSRHQGQNMYYNIADEHVMEIIKLCLDHLNDFKMLS